MFLNTQAITDRVMQTTVDKSNNGYTEEDKRRQTGSWTYPEDIKKQYQKNWSDGIPLFATKKQTSIFSI